jgi:hypothetical protein
MATFAQHADAVAYVERDDVGGEFGSWTDQRHTYTSRHGIYRVWNQTVWVPPPTLDDGERAGPPRERAE